MNENPTPIEAVQKAVVLAGSQAALGNAIDVTQGAISHWLRGHTKPSTGRCIAIEGATNGVVTRYQLRPDIYGVAPPPQN